MGKWLDAFIDARLGRITAEAQKQEQAVDEYIRQQNEEAGSRNRKRASGLPNRDSDHEGPSGVDETKHN